MRIRNVAFTVTCLALFIGGTAHAVAAIRLPAIIGDNMVLQRGQSVPIWGWADKGEEVTVSVAGQTLTTKAADDGRWKVMLAKLDIGEPLEMMIRGSASKAVTLRNILVGDVWLCSGQSNMGVRVANALNAEEEIAAAKYPEMRFITVPTKGTDQPQKDFRGQWVECTPNSATHMSAVAYFFGRMLHRELKVPIGLIHSSWGGSACEAWIKRSALEAEPQFQPMLAQWDKRVRTYDPKVAKEAWSKQLEAWKEREAAAKAAGKKPPVKPPAPVDPSIDRFRPANNYNGMVHPLVPFAIRGAIWYQGETNAGRAKEYRDLFPLLIRQWRDDWAQGDFPFYYVQLANYGRVREKPDDSRWAELREAQAMTLRTPNTGMAVTIDIGEPADIHPKNKQDVGKRLALWALAKTYGKDVPYSGPLYRSMEKKDGQIAIQFDHVHGGLAAKDGKPLKGFAIAGGDKKFERAEARIEGDTVVVSSAKVPDPVAVRYGWADSPICNLYNGAGLPASPFRTDDWESPSVKK